MAFSDWGIHINMGVKGSLSGQLTGVGIDHTRFKVLVPPTLTLDPDSCIVNFFVDTDDLENAE